MQDYDEQLEALRKQREEVASKLREMEEQERQIREALEMKTPTTIMVKRISGNVLVVTSEPRIRTDLLEIFRNTPGRVWHPASQVNHIPLKQWGDMFERLVARPHVTIEYTDGIKEKIEGILNQPIWLVQKVGNVIIAKPGDQANTRLLRRIPTAEWNHENRWYTLPLAEAWRLSMLFDDPEFREAKIDGDVQQLVIEQIQKRATLDDVAKKEDSPEYDIDLQDNRLKPFQRVSVEFIDKAGGRVLLAHQMGLGKTVIAIAYAVHKQFKRTVIVCPAKLKPNWAKEIEKFTGKKPLILSGRVPRPWTVKHVLDSDNPFVVINYDIVGAKTVLKQTDEEGKERTRDVYLWAETIKLLKPDLIVTDEAHYIKNPDAHRSKAVRNLTAPHILPMSGTPIVNRPGEYWPVLHMIDPQLFPYYDRFISDWTLDGAQPKNVEALKELLRPIMYRKTKKEVMKDLPPINVVRRYHELSADADKKYQDVLNGIYEVLRVYDPFGIGGDKKNVMHILTQILRAKQVCAADKVEDSAELAREVFDSNNDGSEDTIKKVIVFSQFKGTAYEVGRLLGNECLSTVRRGAGDFNTLPVNERFQLVEQFQSDPKIHFFSATIKAVGEGLNMTAAWSVIFNDLEWTPKDHSQAMERAYGRMSDVHPIDAYFVLATRPDEKDTIEQYILDLLGFKQDIFDQVVEGVESSRVDKSVAMELIRKIKEMM